MGCCRKDNNKKTAKKKNEKTKTIQANKVEKKKSIINDKEKIIINDEIPAKIIEQTPLKTLPSVSSTPFDDISSTDNISSVKTFDDLQNLVEQNAKAISIVIFYGRYCPYSKRTIPGLRQWARTNQDRIYLYEANVEQAMNLVEYYHIRTIPTLMAFENTNLLVPIWQRTANNVLSSIDTSEPMEITSNDNRQDQSTFESSKLISTVKTKSVRSLTSSDQSPYVWNQSIASIEDKSQKTESIVEYPGRMISHDNLFKNRKYTLDEYYDDKYSPDVPQQQIYLSKSNEIFYQKQYNDHPNEDYSSSTSFDRLSTLTYQHIKDATSHTINQQEEICILYFGPNRCRGFEDNLSIEKASSKISLLTLKSHELIEE